MDLLASFDRIKYPARGRMGGENGKAGYVKIKDKAILNGKGTQLISAGDILEIYTPGGAGLGKVKDRSEINLKYDTDNEMI
jgi:N-methylhydantoinase B/oxoprolinase/acetone carboxylase alpha subunit